MSIYWGDRGKCPECGRFCGNISALIISDMGLVKVDGICKIHGNVDLTKQEWGYDDFVIDQAYLKVKGGKSK